MAQWTTIKTKFGQFCIDRFGKEDGELVYNIYYNIIEFDVKKSKFKAQRDEKFEAQKTHINFLLENVSKETFINACKKIKFDNESGNLPSQFKKASSFRNFVLKFNNNYTLSQSTLHSKVVESKKIIPIQHEKVYDKYKDDTEWFNWSWKCSGCGEIMTPWDTQCKKCSGIILWNERKVN